MHSSLQDQVSIEPFNTDERSFTTINYNPSKDIGYRGITAIAGTTNDPASFKLVRTV